MTGENGLGGDQCRLLLRLFGAYVALAITATAGANKIIALPGNYGASATVFVFLSSLLVLNVINEFFGKEKADLAVNVALVGNVIAVIVFALCAVAPPATFWKGESGADPQAAYTFVLGSSFRFVIAGQAAAFVASRVSNWLVNKAATKPFVIKHTLPLLIAEFVDTSIFVPVAFYGNEQLAEVIIGQYIVKTTFMLVCQPMLFAAIKALADVTHVRYGAG